MNPRILVVLALICTTAAQAGAGGSAGQAATVIVGVAAGEVAVTSAAMGGLARLELPDWKNPETASTSQLSRACDANFETRLIGTNRKNFVYFGIKNESGASRVLKATSVTMTFASGRERTASYPFEVSDYELKPGWKVLALAPFPEKTDFLHQASVTVRVPLYGADGKVVCTLETAFQRPPGVPESQNTSTTFAASDYSMEFGSSLARSGAARAFGSTGFDFGLYIYGYWSLHHGVMFGFNIEDYATLNGNLRSDSFVLGYSYRTRLFRWLYLSWDLAPGFGSFRYDNGGTSGTGDTYFALFSKLSFYFPLGTLEQGALAMDNSLGISLYDRWLPSASWGTTDLSGNGIGLAGFYRFGF